MHRKTGTRTETEPLSPAKRTLSLKGRGWRSGAIVAAMLVAMFCVAGCGPATVPNPYSDTGEPITLAQLDREADRQLADAKAEAESAAKSADRAAREELAEITNSRLDAEADLELAMTTLRSQFAKADRAVDLKLAALQGDLESALDSANRNFAARTSEIGSLRSAAEDRIAQIEAQRASILGLIDMGAQTAGGLGVPGAVQIGGLLTTILTGIGWARSSAKARAAEAAHTASNTSWDEAMAAAEKQRVQLDTTWDQAEMQSKFDALLALVIGRGSETHATKDNTQNTGASAEPGGSTDAAPGTA